MKRTTAWTWAFLSIISGTLLVLSFTKAIPIELTEVMGFVTGAVCVILVVNQNVWNFPVGIANNVFFIVLFCTSRLYGDMALQVVYIALGLVGWRQWLYGGANRTNLRVGRASVREIAIAALAGAIAVAALRGYFMKINDSAPFLDALTTVLSLIAQYFLNCKRIENWFVWIAADVLYVGLYIQKELYLTAVLYAVFIGMCMAGFVSWRKALRVAAPEAAVQ